jgi:hypothetical protein
MNIETLERKLEERSLREGWNLSPEKRKIVLQKTFERATCGDPEWEESATRTLIAAEALELKRQALEQRKAEAEHARKLQLIEYAIRCGLVADVVGPDCIVDGVAAKHKRD